MVENLPETIIEGNFDSKIWINFVLEESKPEPKKRGRPRKTPVKAKAEAPKFDFENFDPNEALSRIDDMEG